MNFKHVGSIILGLLMMWGCQSRSDKQETNEYEQGPLQEQGQMQDTDPFQQQQPQAGEVNDQELRQFVSVVQYVQVINQESQHDMVEALQQGGLDVERFNEIQQAEENPNQEADATDEEMKYYETAIQELTEIQIQAQQKMVDKITEEGLTESRFQEINIALQNDPELQERFRTMLPPTQQAN